LDLDAAVVYRLAYALAADLAEAHEHNMPGTAEAIAAEVLRRVAATDQIQVETIRDAVEDALAERKPRW
jgi:hypothetical protein